jgi:two-component system invasion response regulator UvrY
MAARMVRVLVVDDSAAFLGAAIEVVSAVPDFQIVGIARSGEDAVRTAAAVEPDLVLMDIRMPGIGGLEAAREILAERPDTFVVMLTADSTGLPEDVAAGGRLVLLRKHSLMPAALADLWERRARS